MKSNKAVHFAQLFFSTLIIFSLFGANFTQAAAATGAPYIIVFKDTVNPTSAAPAIAAAYGMDEDEHGL